MARKNTPEEKRLFELWWKYHDKARKTNPNDDPWHGYKGPLPPITGPDWAGIPIIADIARKEGLGGSKPTPAAPTPAGQYKGSNMAAEESLTKQLQDGTLLITPWGEIHLNPKQSSKPKPKPLAPKPTPAPAPAPAPAPTGQQYAPVAPQRTVHMPQPSLPPLPRVSLPYQQLPPMRSGYEPQQGQMPQQGQYPQPYGNQPQGLMPQQQGYPQGYGQQPQGLMPQQPQQLLPQQQPMQQIAPQYQYQPQYQQLMQPQYQQYQQPQGSSMVAPGQMVSYGQPQQQHPMSGILGIVNQILGGL